MHKERKYGLDILRILSMLGIVGLHIVNNGGLKEAADSVLETGIFRCTLALCSCSVNIFAMLTGYLYCDRKRLRSSNLLSLLISTAFYCAAILVVIRLIMPEIFAGFRGLYLYALCPPLNGRYWYLVSYILLFLAIPYINLAIHGLSKRQFRNLLLILFVLLSVVSNIGLNDYFKISGGYSPFWLMYCYMVGAYVKLHSTGFLEKAAPYGLLIVLINVIAVVGLWFVLGDSFLRTRLLLLQYTSPVMVLNAVALLLFFSRITIRSRSLQKIVLSLSNSAFGVYLIHSHILIFDYLLKDAFLCLQNQSALAYTGALLAGLIGIYLVCWLIDAARGWMFRLLRVSYLSNKLGARLDAFLGWDKMI